VFAGLDTRAALPGVREACAAFAPDVVLQEAAEFAGALVAERERVPRVTVGITMGSTEQRFIPAVNERLRPHRSALGLPAEIDLGDAHYFTLTPPALEDPAAPGPAHVRRFREHGAAPAPLPDWWDGADAPLVYLTLGSVAPVMGFFPGLYRAAIDALADLPVRVLVTTGKDADPAELGPLPANVHAEGWVPQARVMPAAAAMVCHGGFGTVRGALAAGVPLVVLPLFADQPYNARRVAALGAGIALEGGHAAVPGLPAAVRGLLEDGTYAARAHAIADEIRALPSVDTAAEILRALAAR
jgi:UDP:flavonoid glycosyltransferase YjiC (YdhE family)